MKDPIEVEVTVLGGSLGSLIVDGEADVSEARRMIQNAFGIPRSAQLFARETQLHSCDMLRTALAGSSVITVLRKYAIFSSSAGPVELNFDQDEAGTPYLEFIRFSRGGEEGGEGAGEEGSGNGGGRDGGGDGQQVPPRVNLEDIKTVRRDPSRLEVISIHYFDEQRALRQLALTTLDGEGDMCVVQSWVDSLRREIQDLRHAKRRASLIDRQAVAT